MRTTSCRQKGQAPGNPTTTDTPSGRSVEENAARFIQPTNLRKRTNPTHGSGWIVQFQPTPDRFWYGIPPTEVGGLFKSSLQWDRSPRTPTAASCTVGWK